MLKERLRQPCGLWYGLHLSHPVFVVTITTIIAIIIITDSFLSFYLRAGLRFCI
jgi:hypothetical protein